MDENTTAGLLAGVRVVSLAFNIPGPVAARRLREMGAEVTKIEPPAGDPLSHACPAWFHALIEGQHVLTLDLKRDEGREKLAAILAGTDLLLTSMRPTALERLGLGPAALSVQYPRLCHVAVVGYRAPDQNRAGHDLTYQAAAGLIRPPHLPLTLVADLAAAERAVSTALALLLALARGGRGGYAEVAIADAVTVFADPLRYELTGPGALLGGALPVYALYPASEGWVALAALEPHFLDRLLGELGLDSIDPVGLETVFRTRTATEWQDWAHERDLPITAVREALFTGPAHLATDAPLWQTARGR